MGGGYRKAAAIPRVREDFQKMLAQAGLVSILEPYAHLHACDCTAVYGTDARWCVRSGTQRMGGLPPDFRLPFSYTGNKGCIN